MAWDNHKWRAALKRRGRYRNPSVCPHSISTGTLIIDSPTPGWGLTQCWWTSDDITAISPVPIPTSEDRDAHTRADTDKLEMPFDVWVYEQYLNADCGSATLLAFRRGERYARRLTKTKPGLTCVESWSAPVPRSERITDESG